ncbi:MAG: hypothetical protein WDW38_003706 [Sanguina aurantia]
MVAGDSHIQFGFEVAALAEVGGVEVTVGQEHDERGGQHRHAEDDEDRREADAPHEQHLRNQLDTRVCPQVLEPSGGYLLDLKEAKAKHCELTAGSWCGPFFAQTPVPRKPPPLGDKNCPSDCNGVGNCDYDTGICYCPAGYGGDGCTEPRKRTCYQQGPDKMDLGLARPNTGWSHTRCAGICDDNIAMCYCPPDSKYGHRPAPEGSPAGTKPIQQGRPLFMCFPKEDKDGNRVEFGGMSYEGLLGPDGWCNNDLPSYQAGQVCPCRLDGLWGERCDIPIEHFCINQCGGHGECELGFCKCHDGYYGQDCARRRRGLVAGPGDELLSKPWLQPVLNRIIAAANPPLTPTRLRPFIFVYELDSAFYTDILQYRIEKSHGLYRQFHGSNRSEWTGYNAYAIESAIHELFLSSEHRTYDPEEADYFYIPAHTAGLADVYGWNRVPQWPAGLHATRTFGMSEMVRAAKRWIADKFPYFNRTGAQTTSGFGRTMRGRVRHHRRSGRRLNLGTPLSMQGIMLTHWGRMDFPHFSNTGYGADNYSLEFEHRELPGGFLATTSQAHPCYDPVKDLAIPLFKDPNHMHASPYLGRPQPKRDLLMSFRGDMGRHRGHDTMCFYSRCLRQRLYNISQTQRWNETYNIHIGERDDVSGEYSDLLTRSVFAILLPGEGWSSRMEDALLNGAIPVVILDDTHVALESLLDFSQFVVRVAQRDLANLAAIIAAVTPERIRQMQDNVHRVWHRYRYLDLEMVRRDTRERIERNRLDNGGTLPEQPGSHMAQDPRDDAFSTIVQWLYARIPFTRGSDATRASAAKAVAAHTRPRGRK